MLNTTSTRRLRTVLAGLLFLYFTPAAMPNHWLCRWTRSGAGPEAVFLIPRFANSAAVIFAKGARNRLNGIDNLTPAAILPGRVSVGFAGKSSHLPIIHKAEVLLGEAPKAFLVRAPPANL